MLESQLSEAISTARNLNSLDNAARLMWRGHGEGLFDDSTAERLSAAIEARRNAFRHRSPKAPAKPHRAHSRPCRSPDRARSIRRRRRLAASGAVPGTIAANFTTGEIAALTVIARQCQRSRSCDWFMDRIAAVAGVSRTTVRNALRQAQTLGLVSVQERRLTAWRSDSNIIRVVSAEWLAWLGLGGGCKKTRTKSNHSYSQTETAVDNGHNLQLFRVCSSHSMARIVDSRDAKPRHDYRSALDR